jgi:hypothetical protein
MRMKVENLHNNRSAEVELNSTSWDQVIVLPRKFADFQIRGYTSIYYDRVSHDAITTPTYLPDGVLRLG